MQISNDTKNGRAKKESLASSLGSNNALIVVKRYNYQILCTIVALLLAVGICCAQVQAQESQTTPPVEPTTTASDFLANITPAKIDEPFKTWYLGDIAVDIPESMALDGQLQFSIRPDAENSNITIGFNDISTDEVKNKEYGLTSSEPLYRPAGSQVFFWKPVAQKNRRYQYNNGQARGLEHILRP